MATAADGATALAAVRRQRPDAAVLDLMIPGMDGHVFLRTFRGAPEWATIPVVILSAVADES